MTDFLSRALNAEPTPNEHPARVAKDYGRLFRKDADHLDEQARAEFEEYARAELKRHDWDYDALRARFLSDYHAARDAERREAKAAEREAALAEHQREEAELASREVDVELARRKAEWIAAGGTDFPTERVRQEIVAGRVAAHRSRAVSPREYLS